MKGASVEMAGLTAVHICVTMGIILQVPLMWMKREPGASPGRTRRCNLTPFIGEPFQYIVPLLVKREGR